MLWEFLGIVGVFSLWAACGLLPWSVALIAGRGRGAFSTLPFAIAAGIAGGLLTAVFAKDGIGFAVSLLAATAASAIAIAAFRRVTMKVIAHGR